MPYKDWYEYEKFSEEEIDELIDRTEGLMSIPRRSTEPWKDFNPDYIVLCMELGIVMRKFKIHLLQERLKQDG